MGQCLITRNTKRKLKFTRLWLNPNWNNQPLGVIATDDYTKYEFFIIVGQSEIERNIALDHTIPMTQLNAWSIAFLGIIAVGGSSLTASSAGHPVLISETQIKVGSLFL